MDRNRTADVVAVKPAYSADGTPGFIGPTTEIPAQMFNLIIEEIRNTILMLGGTPSAIDDTQLATLLNEALTIAGSWTDKIRVGKDPDAVPTAYLTTIDVEETGPAVYKGYVQTDRVYASEGFFTGAPGAAVERIDSAGNAILANVSAGQMTVSVLTETAALWIAEQADMGGAIPALKTIIITHQIYTDGALAFPPIAYAAQRLYRIRNAGVGNLILTKRAGTSETIEGGDTFTIAAGKCATFVATATDWVYVAQ